VERDHPLRAELLPLDLRRVHRWAAWIGGAQLVVWAVTGCAFSFFDFAAVRGRGDRAPSASVDFSRVKISPAQAAQLFARIADDHGWAVGGGPPGINSKARAVHSLGVVALGDRVAYLVDDAQLIDAGDGGAFEVDAALAATIARRAHVGDVQAASVESATASDPDVGLPAWRVRLDDRAHTVVFVAQKTGAIVGWRNDTWRRFDFLWSLHVLGWVDRDQPAHTPMRIVALLALLLVASGVLLLFKR
jgi:uncharacterized iron-regulated membrane protein